MTADFIVNTTSHLITAPTATPLAELQPYLEQNGFFLGYLPLLCKSDEPLSFYLDRHTANLYHYKYGSLADRVSSLEVVLPTGQKFRLNDAPRSAIGPDFNRAVIGSQNTFGKILNVTLKIVNKPEKISHLIVGLPGEEAAAEFVRSLVGRFLTPLYFVFVVKLKSKKLLKNLKMKIHGDILILCHAGLEELVALETSLAKSYCQERNYPCFDVVGKKQIGFVEKFIGDRQIQEIIEQQYRSFLWPASDNQSQKMMEQGMKTHV